MKPLIKLGLLGILLVLAGCGKDAVKPFTVELKSSAASMNVVGVLTLTATASREAKVIEFYEGETKLGEVTATPYSLELPLGASNNGEHNYAAKATSSQDEVAQSKPVKVTVAISDPNPNPNPEPTPTLSLSPSAVTLTPAGTPTTFTATVSDSSMQVSWKLEGLGSISAAQGLTTLYTPPASISKTETATLTASVAGTSLTTAATITLSQTAPTIGGITVTVNGLSGVDADITVTGPDGFNQKITKTTTLNDLKPGSYTVAAKEVTKGADKYQPDKALQGLDVKPGQTLNAVVAYSLVKTTASLRITIEGLPSGTDAQVALFYPGGGFTPFITRTSTISDLPPGKYKVVGQSITGEGYEYKASPEIQDIELKAGDAKSVNVKYVFSQSILFVNASMGADTNQGLKDKPFKTITKALDKVVAGQTVLVQNGTYGASSGEAFPLRVKSGVALEGETFRGIAIIGNGVCLSLNNVSDIRVSKLGFQCDIGIYLQDVASTLLEQVVVASGSNGVVVRNSAMVLDTVETYNNDEGLSVEGTSTVTFNNSKAFRNRTGISLLGSAQLTVENSSVSENLDTGIFVAQTSKLEINNSHIDSNGNSSHPVNGGLFIIQSSGGSVSIANSTINSNINSGINLACSTPMSNAGNFTMTNSQIMSNDAFGLCVGNTTGIISLKQNLFGFNKLIQIYDNRPANQSAPIFAPQTSIDDGAGIYDLSGTKTGPAQDTNVWKITGANNKICFEACL